MQGPHSPLFLCSQLMQQQAALVAAHSAYLSPMATMAAVQMQHMAAINANGLIATPITPSSGKVQAGLGWAGVQEAGRGSFHMVEVGRGLRALLREAWGLGGVRGQTVACFLPSASRLADRFSASVCVCFCFSALSLLLSPPQEPARLLPSLPHPSLPSLLPWASTATAQCPPSPPGSLPLTLYIPTGFTPTQVGFSARPPTALPSSHPPHH